MSDAPSLLAPDPCPLDPAASTVSLQRLLLGRGALPLYALVDGASAHDLLTVVRELRAEGVHCLHGRTLSGDAARVAPYLIHLERGSPLVDWLMSEGWGKSWGIFLRSQAEPQVLLRHLRGFRTVLSPEGDALVLRFYDPRTLRVLLPTLDAHQVARLFGGVLCVDAEGAEAGRCPVCDAELPTNASLCGGCEARFTQPDGSGPVLIHSLLLEGRSPLVLECFRPWRSEEERAVEAPEQHPAPRRELAREGPLQLSDEQLQAFGDDMNRRDYEVWAVDHLTQVFPERCAKLGSWGVRNSIWFAWERATSHGLREPAQITRYLDIMYLWAMDFEEHVDGPWAAILEDAGLEPQAKADRLWEVAREQVAAMRARMGSAS